MSSGVEIALPDLVWGEAELPTEEVENPGGLGSLCPSRNSDPTVICVLL